MTVKQNILTASPCYKARRKIAVKGLMLHSVGCAQPSAEVFCRQFANYSGAAVHAFIDANTGIVYQTLPWNHRAWHCGDSANNTHIGVEMCESAFVKYTSGTSLYMTNKTRAQADCRRAYEAAVELFADLCRKYSLDPMKSGVIVSHKEGHARGIASNHGDPEHYWKGCGMSYTMDGFRKAVKQKLTGSDSGPKTSTDKSSIDWAKTLQEALNVSYELNLKVDGKVMAKTKQAIDHHYLCYVRQRPMRNAHVSWLQAALNELGYDIGVDGSFGPQCDRILKEFQRDQGIDVDGYAGVQTHLTILKALQK